MEAKHTPGPWLVGEERHAAGYQLVMAEARHRGFVCEVQAPLLNGDHDHITREANARLISAAPDMLEALRSVREFVESEVENRGAAGSEMSDYRDEAQEALDRIDAAIAKAEGRQ